MFKCKRIIDNHDIYQNIDTLLLADVFENFGTTSLETYHFDPATYFKSSSETFRREIILYVRSWSVIFKRKRNLRRNFYNHS